MPPKIQARMLKLLELIETHGTNLGPPHTEAMGNGLFEVRAKAQEGIGRSLYCYMKGKHNMVLHAFVKKSAKTPKQELNLALQSEWERKKVTFLDWRKEAAIQAGKHWKNTRMPVLSFFRIRHIYYCSLKFNISMRRINISRCKV